MDAGASNETISLDLRVECDGCSFDLALVLRPQRPDGILAPYDVGRQFLVMRALKRAGVLVPAVAWHEPSGDVIGAPFFVMERVAGETLPLVSEQRSARMAAAGRALATVHAVDWRATGLAFLNPSVQTALAETSPVALELASWRARAERLRISRVPLLVSLASWLEANEPSDARVVFLHGDPNPSNFLFRGDDVVAVLDWELAALGDPRSDLGFYSALLTVFHGDPPVGGRTVLSEAYEAATGKDLTALGYYEALGLYKMAIVLAGWARSGGGGNGASMDAIVRRLSVLLGPRWAA
jgi:aminoglycoside phosphotransferase (APT) family kinase protein